MELFENSRSLTSQPLAFRMRPRTLDEYIGQEHIVGEGRLLRRAIQADQLSSVIFYGPPGTGKTTLARVIANTTKSHFSTINAVLSGVKELREEIEAAKERLDLYNTRTILFIDEVHRWNKSQQDALLPWVENGTFILIGATTENPFFEVNAALVSRSRIFQLKSLTDKDLINIAKQALNDKVRGYGNLNVSFEKGALEHLVEVAKGDARSLLNALELAVETTKRDGQSVYITKEAAEESIQRKAVLYDKEGDYHFDVISAFIKSLRGSDPDAALYWLAKMVYAGEDPRFIFRRMLISACEDIGLADPNAISIVVADAQAFNMVGMPEGNFHLTHAALYLATAPKSNSTLAYFDALKTIEMEEKAAEVPNHLRDQSRDSEAFAHGQGYMYPHAYENHWVAQQYLPTELQGKIYYQPGNLGYEKTISDLVNQRREIQLESVDVNAFPENLTFSPDDKGRELWIRRTADGRSKALINLRTTIFNKLNLIRSDRVLIVNAGHGMLLWEAYRKTPEGLVCATVQSDEDLQYINHKIEELKTLEAPMIVRDLNQIDSKIKFEHIIGRNVFVNKSEEQIKAIIKALKGKFTDNTDFVFAETIPGEASRLSDFIHEGTLKTKLLKAEEYIYASDERKRLIDTVKNLKSNIQVEDFNFTESRNVSPEDVKRWVTKSYAPALKEEPENLISELTPILTNAPLIWKTSCLIIY